MDTITLNPPRTRRRRYSREFKTQIVEACKQPGTSVAAIARMHDINDNIVHRWLREAEQAGADWRPTRPSPARLESVPIAAPFVPVQVSTPSQDSIHLELIKNGLLRKRSPACKRCWHCCDDSPGTGLSGGRTR